MNLIIDFGNSFAKLYLFDNENIVRQFRLEYIHFFEYGNTTDSKKIFVKTNSLFLSSFFENNSISFKNAIISSVIDFPSDFFKFIQNLIPNGKVLIMNLETKIPIQNHYKGKHLGNDRLAAAVGGNWLFSNKNLLIIDAGSAITYEFISQKNEYLGGNISAGMQMRFKALNFFTNKLPLVSEKIEILDTNNIGYDTFSAIYHGVIEGIVYEMNGFIEKTLLQFGNAKILLTGGDSFFFEKKIKNCIFANPNLVAIGLNRILNYNIYN
jgi:type III pantothenate kinase